METLIKLAKKLSPFIAGWSFSDLLDYFTDEDDNSSPSAFKYILLGVISALLALVMYLGKSTKSNKTNTDETVS